MTSPMKIAEKQQAAKSSFELEEVKVTFTKDTKTAISGIDVNGRRGDMLNLPRWVARDLEDDGYLEITEQDMKSELTQARSKQNLQGDFQLADLEEHFYIKLEDYMKKQDHVTRLEMSSTLNELVRSRISAISRLVISSKLTPENSEKLTIEERELYHAIHKLYQEFEGHVMKK